MAQRKQLSWSELRVGIFVLVGLFILILAIFYVTGSGFWGPKYTLRTYLPEVDGLESGAPVQLDGVPIGNVDTVRLNDHPSTKQQSVAVTFRVDKRYQDQIRTDSTASLMTQGLLGDRYVAVTRGFTGSVIPANGTVQGVENNPMQQIEARGADVMENMQELSKDLGDIVQEIQKGNGTLGKLIKDPSMYNNLNHSIATVDAMLTSIQKGNGTLGKFIVSDEIYNKTDAIAGDVHDMTSAIRDQKGLAGRLIYDPGLGQDVTQIASNTNKLVGGVQQGQGSLGKFVKDDTVYNNLRDASANVRDATGKLNSNQGTLGKLFSDPALYNNMTGLSGDLRLLINDFRRNPKKFLRIKVSVF
ncbi:MAG TPA: MlaD family protein [Candidatus Acidoferrales bacterium]|nr:MlaD family protein [Candidatus Acidoferrales bacterium]